MGKCWLIYPASLLHKCIVKIWLWGWSLVTTIPLLLLHRRRCLRFSLLPAQCKKCVSTCSYVPCWIKSGWTSGKQSRRADRFNNITFEPFSRKFNSLEISFASLAIFTSSCTLRGTCSTRCSSVCFVFHDFPKTLNSTASAEKDLGECLMHYKIIL